MSELLDYDNMIVKHLEHIENRIERFSLQNYAAAGAVFLAHFGTNEVPPSLVKGTIIALGVVFTVARRPVFHRGARQAQAGQSAEPQGSRSRHPHRRAARSQVGGRHRPRAGGGRGSRFLHRAEARASPRPRARGARPVCGLSATMRPEAAEGVAVAVLSAITAEPERLGQRSPGCNPSSRATPRATPHSSPAYSTT
jgi:hypothetical protein